jgi:hypothetical protein
MAPSNAASRDLMTSRFQSPPCGNIMVIREIFVPRYAVCIDDCQRIGAIAQRLGTALVSDPIRTYGFYDHCAQMAA